MITLNIHIGAQSEEFKKLVAFLHQEKMVFERTETVNTVELQKKIDKIQALVAAARRK